MPVGFPGRRFVRLARNAGVQARTSKGVVVKSRGARPGVVILVVAIGMSSFAALGTPLSSQTQIWRVTIPDCTVTQSWKQSPAPPNARRISASLAVSCADPSVTINALIHLTGEQTKFVSGQSGSVQLSYDNVRPRHGLLYNFSVSVGLFTHQPNSLPVGPPQCIPGPLSGYLQCNFDQYFVALTDQPYVTAPSSPTPFSFYRQAQGVGKICTWRATAERVADVGIRFTFSQNCKGGGSFEIYPDRNEAYSVASGSYSSSQCDLLSQLDPGLTPGPHPDDCSTKPPPYKASATVVPALKGNTFVVEWFTNARKVLGSLPPECRLSSTGNIASCNFQLVVKVAG